MSEANFYRGSENLLKTSKLIRAVYAPLERKNPNVQNFLLNFTKTVRDSIDQLTGSKAIEIPTAIEPNDEVALASPETIRQYSAYLVGSSHPGLLDCQDQRKAARHRFNRCTHRVNAQSSLGQRRRTCALNDFG